MECVLDVALSNVGGSIDMLENAIDEIAAQPARGPRDEVIREILNKLLSVQRYVLLDFII